jgi:hypothetical protein
LSDEVGELGPTPSRVGRELELLEQHIPERLPAALVTCRNQVEGGGASWAPLHAGLVEGEPKEKTERRMCAWVKGRHKRAYNTWSVSCMTQLWGCNAKEGNQFIIKEKEISGIGLLK